MSEEKQKAMDIINMPEKGKGMHRAYRFLVSELGINYRFVMPLIQSGDLYADKDNNAVFVHRDQSGNVIGGEIVATDGSGKVSLVEGTKNSPFEIKVKENMTNRIADRSLVTDEVRVFDNVKNMLAYMTMNPYEKNVTYASMGGYNLDIPTIYSDNNRLVDVHVSNDLNGRRFANQHKLQVHFDSGYKLMVNTLISTRPQDFEGIKPLEIRSNKSSEHVCGIVAGGMVYMFPTQKSYEYYKTKLPANAKVHVLPDVKQNSIRIPEDWKVKNWAEALVKKCEAQQNPRKRSLAKYLNPQAHNETEAQRAYKELRQHLHNTKPETKPKQIDWGGR